MKERGYQVFIVHPEAQEIEGERCYSSLEALKGQIDGVLVSVPPAQAVQVVRDAAAAGLKKVWLQQGAESVEVLAVAKDLGLQPVSGKCIMMYADPVRSVHTWRRAFAKLFGQY